MPLNLTFCTFNSCKIKPRGSEYTCKNSPVTMTLRRCASLRILITLALSGFAKFFMSSKPRNCMSFSTSPLWRDTQLKLPVAIKELSCYEEVINTGRILTVQWSWSQSFYLLIYSQVQELWGLHWRNFAVRWRTVLALLDKNIKFMKRIKKHKIQNSHTHHLHLEMLVFHWPVLIYTEVVR